MFFHKKLNEKISTLETTMSQMKQELQDTRNKLASLQFDVENLRNDLNESKKALKSFTSSVSKLEEGCNQKCDVLTGSITALRNNLNALENKAAELKADYDHTKKIVVYKRKKVQDKILGEE